MKTKHLIIYLLLFLSLSVMIMIFYYNYKIDSDKVLIKKKVEKIEKNKSLQNDISSEVSKVSVKSNPTIIENVKYVALDVSGNKFEIDAKEGTTNSRNYDEIFLKDVVATIWLYNSEKVIITSNSANYNKSSIETAFEDNVEINYINHKINSNKLLLSFKDKIAIITNNVTYIGNNTNLYTDNIEIDFKTKKTKIFMNDKNKKIFVKSIY